MCNKGPFNNLDLISYILISFLAETEKHKSEVTLHEMFLAKNLDWQLPAVDDLVTLIVHFPFDNKFQLKKKGNKNNAVSFTCI